MYNFCIFKFDLIKLDVQNLCNELVEFCISFCFYSSSYYQAINWFLKDISRQLIFTFCFLYIIIRR